ncbi:glycosyltransferase family 2 protein [Jeotgalibacillus malaysiensis]|uniref:glycosyltransferase family 2 protein n=1 Tax=Jeotgalibacillus malaysiensis TaxID=1508404 RepID=UPI00384DBC8B
MKQPVTVSIVVPVYKVEQYLRKCLDSILEQTYPHLQIIIVDDGSPDRSGDIADQYAKQDSRIQVIHQENKGLSGARNTGIQYAAGEYTVYLDSDDWLEQFAIEKLVWLAQKYKADLVQSNFYYAYEHEQLVDYRYQQADDRPLLLSREQAIEALIINQKLKNFAWGKLYKTELIKDIPFQEGRLFEDVLWAYLVMKKAERVVLDAEPLFYYLQRETSITADYSPRNLDFIKGLKERHQMITTDFPELIPLSNKEILRATLLHHQLLYFNREKDQQGVHRKKLEKSVKEGYQKFEISVEDEPVLAKQLKFFYRHPSLNLGFLLVRKSLRRAKLLPAPARLERVKIKRG